jgi:sugar phosphate isomerase/epimerase
LTPVTLGEVGATRTLSRRRFLETAAAVPAASFLARAPFLAPAIRAAASGFRAAPADEPLFRISLAEWSLHRALGAGTLDHLDFPRTAKRVYDLDAVEYVNTFFGVHGEERGYLADLKSRCDDEGVRSLDIMCDGEGAIGAPDPGARTRAVENHYKWVDAARYLGCHSIRVNAQSEGTPEEQRDRVVDGLRRLVEYGTDREINIIVENHGGLSSDGGWLWSVMRAVHHPGCGTLPDFGNFSLRPGEEYDRYQGVAEMMPYAKAVSAKSHDFDAEGNETGIDYVRMVRIVLAAGYRGYIGIEYEGSRLSEPEGIRATKALLERVRDELAGEFEQR